MALRATTGWRPSPCRFSIAGARASLNILWIRSAFTVEEFAKRHLGDLQTAARQIITSLGDRTNIHSAR